ncbi:MAG TPA: hypothetical protein VF668_07860 [Pyrinomonadaceae bacterium]|jgi:hypothetical protein
MSSGKPQTRGLAALLRIEKERRAREDGAADEPADATPEGGQERPAPRAVPVGVPATESERESAPPAGEMPAQGTQEGFGRAAEEVAGAVSAQQTDAAPAALSASEGAEKRQTVTERHSAPVASLPSPRPAQARGARSLRRKPAPALEQAFVDDPGWEKFMSDWKPFLREGVKFKLCEFFYRSTVAAGRREFTTSTAQLSRVSGAHRRHIFLVLRQLEDLRFIQKESVGTNRKDEGLVIRFFPDRTA